MVLGCSEDSPSGTHEHTDGDVSDLDGGHDDVDTCETGETKQYVVAVLDVAQPDPDNTGVINGFNIDDHVTVEDDAVGCFKEDLTSPDGEPGIDNQLGLVIGDIPGVDVTTSIADNIAEGDLLLLMEV
jgi:hypothetical protein